MVDGQTGTQNSSSPARSEVHQASLFDHLNDGPDKTALVAVLKRKKREKRGRFRLPSHWSTPADKKPGYTDAFENLDASEASESGSDEPSAATRASAGDDSMAKRPLLHRLAPASQEFRALRNAFVAKNPDYFAGGRDRHTVLEGVAPVAAWRIENHALFRKYRDSRTKLRSGWRN
jgi:hypothetical protein